jgi:molybdopterin-guanine dinucleotide biosynthesis protein MobB
MDSVVTSPPVVSIVGKSDSGKTTLIERLIPALSARGYRVATIKHDAHSFDVDHEGKDTWRHREAGACAVAITSSERVFLTRRVSRSPSLEEVCAAYFSEGVDLVLTEGFRRAGAPKIEVHRAARSDGLICDPTVDPLIAVASDHPWELSVPVFHLDDIPAIADLIESTYLR